MSYLYKATFDNSSKTFIIPESPPTDNVFATALYNTLYEYNNKHRIKSSKESRLEFYIAYHRDLEFYQRNKKKVFCQYVFLRKKEKLDKDVYSSDYFINEAFNKEEISITNLKALPIIHITSLNLFEEKEERDHYYKVPRYIRVLDNSIWNLYVPSPDTDKTEENPETEEYDPFKLKDQITKIVDNQHLYKLTIAQEAADFYARLAYNSYLSGGDHSDNVVPFLFHSESEMKKKTEDGLGKIQEIIGDKKIKWRILIVDDFVEKPLIYGIKNKVELITDVLKEHFNVEDHSSKSNCKLTIKIESKNNIREAKDALNAKRYDLILLDYQLGEKDNNTEEKNENQLPEKEGREYGYHLLEKIRNTPADELKTIKGIYGRFWFLNISSFSYAVEERMREKGLGYHTEHWHFYRGASPVITPELFMYELTHFFKRQIQIISELPLLPKNHKTEDKERILTIIDLLEIIYFIGNESPRERAVKYFDAVLNVKAIYKALKKDYYYYLNEDEKKNNFGEERKRKEKENGSLLVQALFPDLEYYENAFWEHLMHLVYVTAFGTIRQWPEMWEEFLFVKGYFQRIKNDESKKQPAKERNEKESKNSIVKKIEEIEKAIEKYIINLKAGIS